MKCQPGCGACCIALSISSPIPGMPEGKPAMVPCIHLDEERRCAIFTDPARPAVCASLRPEPLMCGGGAVEAMRYLEQLELATRP